MEGKDIPILALYGGKDQLIGFIQYARLKETAVKYGNTLQLVYSRYGGHGLSEFEHEEGKIAAKDFHFYILKFSEDYFNKNSSLTIGLLYLFFIIASFTVSGSISGRVSSSFSIK